MAEPIHVLHLCHHSVVRQGILRSQVAEPMKRLARNPRLKITVVSAERSDERDPMAERDLSRDLAGAGVSLHVLEKRVAPAARTARPPLLKRVLSPMHLAWDVLRLRRLAFRFAREHRPCVIHARSYIAAWAALGVRRRELCRLVFDPRGALPEELAAAQGWAADSRRYLWWRDLERRLLRGADTVIAVSEPMAAHFAERADVSPVVIRNCVDLERFSPGTRTPAPGAPLRLVFLVGVDVPYQASELALTLRRAVAAGWPAGAILRVITPDADAMRARLGSPEVSCDSLARDAIPAALAESDLGVLVRDSTVGSLVACPVKFPEYLAAGLPVLATRGIGEVDAILRDRGVGVSLDPSATSEWPRHLAPLLARLTSQREELRQSARRAAEEIFAWEHSLPLLEHAYGLWR